MNTIPQRVWQFGTALIVLLVVFVAALSLKTFREIGQVGTTPSSVATISVDGSGEAFAVPDIATFSFSVTETAKTVAAAQEAATKKINAALKEVRDQGVADKDISTQSYNINPHYEYQSATCPARTDGTVVYCPNGKNILTGYDVSQGISVKVRDLSKAGSLFTAIGGLGVQNVSGLNFSVDHPENIRAEARAKAIAEAQEKAEVLADKLGVRLVRITNFSEYNNTPRPYIYTMSAKAAGADSAMAPEVPAGEQTVTSNVTITYEIR